MPQRWLFAAANISGSQSRFDRVFVLYSGMDVRLSEEEHQDLIQTPSGPFEFVMGMMKPALQPTVFPILP